MVNAALTATLAAPPGSSSGIWSRIAVMLLVTVIMWASLRPVERIRQIAATSIGARLPNPHESLVAQQMRYERRRRWMRRARAVSRILPEGPRWKFRRGGSSTPVLDAEPAESHERVRAHGRILRPEATRLTTGARPDRSALASSQGPHGGAGGGQLPPGAPQPALPRGPRPLGGGGAAAARPIPLESHRGGGRPESGPGAGPEPTGPRGPQPPLFRPDGGGRARPEPIPARRRPARLGSGEAVFEIWDPRTAPQRALPPRRAEARPRQSPPPQAARKPFPQKPSPGYYSTQPRRPRPENGER